MSPTLPTVEDILRPTDLGLYSPIGDFFIDPVRPVPRALITHGHADHARAGHSHVMATAETLDIMAVRYGPKFAGARQVAELGQTITHNAVAISFHPAGHVLGSAQIALEVGGRKIVVSGDYKRRADPTCRGFEPVPCDVFVTEATFALPVFVHPPTEEEIGKVLTSLAQFPDRAHLIGAYALGKAQRVICELRAAGYGEVIYLHGALKRLCNLYERLGVDLGPLAPVTGAKKEAMKGSVVMCPPSALNDRWSRRVGDAVTAFASGWMRVRARARQRGVELPLVISDHADWQELIDTIRDVSPEALWVTHGSEDALVHYAKGLGIDARPLSLVGYGDDDAEIVGAEVAAGDDRGNDPETEGAA
ncbi:MAG: ligase-associated DNA damage response exonuclease [Pseudomonadota bacterium]